MSEWNIVEVNTNAGLISIDRNLDPMAPGCNIAFQPKGTNRFFRLCYIEVNESEFYSRPDGETDEDICVYIYGDCHSEDFTDKVVIRREDALEVVKKELSGPACITVL